MGLPVVTVVAGGLPIVESTVGGTPVTEAANGYGVPVTKVVGKPGLPVVFETIGVAPSVPVLTTFATLDGTAVNGVVVSNGGLTATHTTTSNNAGVSSAMFKSSGKYYFEVTATLSQFAGSGVGIKTAAATYVWPIASVTHVITATANCDIWALGVFTTKNVGPFVAGDKFGIAIDLDAGLVWFRKNNGNWNGDAAANPATGVGGVAIPAGSLSPAVRFSSGFAADNMTANFGATAFNGAVPSGFISGWGT